MKIVADENIPLLDHYFGSHSELLLKPGRLITRDDLFDADILLVRSVTKVNELLLHNTPVKFVGSTTAGADHLDTEWLDHAGIAWDVAAGCNALAVSEYVICVIAALQKQGLLLQAKMRAGVVGVGNVGRLVVDKLQKLGFEVIQYDPLRAEHEENFASVSWDEMQDLDFISLHTPLTYQGAYPTHHLIEKSFLQRQKPGCVLLSAGRGEVVSFEDLKQYGKHLHWCLDVWENEPLIDLDVLVEALIATPHIAGYSVESKLRGIEMIYQIAIEKNVVPESTVLPVLSPEYENPVKKINMSNWRDAVLQIYDPQETTTIMKKVLSEGLASFDYLRKNFPERHEFACYHISLEEMIFKS
jgi:erythronate-4-phosphate dehydrogenase